MTWCGRILLSIGISCIVLWFISIAAPGEVLWHRVGLGLELGDVFLALDSMDLKIGPVIGFEWGGDIAGLEQIGWRPRIVELPWGTQIRVPLWMPGVGFGLAGVSVWLRRRYRSRSKGSGVCAKCGYSLRGLTNSVCPECGTSFRRGRGGTETPGHRKSGSWCRNEALYWMALALSLNALEGPFGNCRGCRLGRFLFPTAKWTETWVWRRRTKPTRRQSFLISITCFLLLLPVSALVMSRVMSSFFASFSGMNPGGLRCSETLMLIIFIGGTFGIPFIVARVLHTKLRWVLVLTKSEPGRTPR